jgi:hypothetical protein
MVYPTLAGSSLHISPQAPIWVVHPTSILVAVCMCFHTHSLVYMFAGDSLKFSWCYRRSPFVFPVQPLVVQHPVLKPMRVQAAILLFSSPISISILPTTAFVDISRSASFTSCNLSRKSCAPVRLFMLVVKRFFGGVLDFRFRPVFRLRPFRDFHCRIRINFPSPLPLFQCLFPSPTCISIPPLCYFSVFLICFPLMLHPFPLPSSSSFISLSVCVVVRLHLGDCLGWLNGYGIVHGLGYCMFWIFDFEYYSFSAGGMASALRIHGKRIEIWMNGSTGSLF